MGLCVEAARKGLLLLAVFPWFWGWRDWVAVVAYDSHALAEDLDEDLVVDSAGICEEEEAQGDVEERYGRDEGLGCYESHGGGCDGLLIVGFGR